MTDQTTPEPFRFTDADGDYLHIGIPNSPTGGSPAVSFHTMAEPVHVPVEELEGLIAAVRSMAAVQAPAAPLPVSEARTRLLQALDASYCQALGHTPEGLLAAYEASRTQAVDDRAVEALSDTLYDALYAITPFAEKYFADEREGLRSAVRAVLEQAAVLPATTRHDTDTAPAATCSAQYHGLGEDRARLCIRAAQHQRTAHTDEHGFHWSDTVAMYPVADGTFRIGTDARAELRRVADDEPAAGARQDGAQP